MKAPALLFAIIAGGIGGCATAPPVELPAAAREIALVPVSSASVTVRPSLLHQRDGRLELVGFVTKVYGAKTTERTHLDIVFFDVDGTSLRTQITQFSPQRLTRGHRAPNRQAFYSVTIDALPAGTSRIEVRAHDGPHASP